MQALELDIKSAAGRLLYCTIFRPDGKKLLAKGHLLTGDDVKLLETEGLERVWVADFASDEVAEDTAVTTVASLIGCGSVEIRLAAGGRANVFATEACAVLVDDDVLRQFNGAAPLVIATLRNFSYVKQGNRIATVKSFPFAVARSELEAVISILKERGPVLQARPIRSPAVAVLYSDACDGERARQFFENIIRQRLGQYGLEVNASLSCVEEEERVIFSLEQLLRSKPAVILAASTTAPVGPGDVLGRAMIRAGFSIERYLAPVEPGNLLLLAYKKDVPVISAPGCFRSAKPNIVDLLLPPILARYRVSGWEIASLGHGGLLA